MDATDRHRFRVLMGLRKDYRQLHAAGWAVVTARNNGAYEFRGEGDDPIDALVAALNDQDSRELDRLEAPLE